MPLFILDQYIEHPLAMMAPVKGDELDVKIEADYMK